VLLWPALVLLLAGALIDFISGVSPVGIAYDHALIDAALAVSAHVRAGANGRLILDLPSSTTGILRTDPEDSIFFRVSTPDGRFIAGDYDLPHVLGNNGNPSLSDSTFRGEPIRRVTLRTHTSTGPADVTVAETVRKRQRVRTQLLSIDLGADTQPAPVIGVPWLLQELLNNLIENSLVNTPAGGAVTARCGTEGPLAFLEVLDTGVGIPEDERGLVTERFFRGRNTRGDGSGLGLAIVSEIARLHAGRLAIGPGRDGRGTCVRVLFPAS
jgi:hypothetical protein